jgi:hypothetical protein
LPAFLAVGDQASVVSRLAGAMTYPLLAWLLARILLVARPAVLAVALAAGATGLAIHAQIEMTATQPGSAAWFAVALALAAAFAQVHDRPNLAASRPRLSHRPLAAGIALGLVAFALFIAIIFAHPAYEQEQWEAAAAEPLRPVAQTLAAGEPIDANALIAGRLAAADRLERAYAAWPARPWPLLAAARQLERTADLVQGNEEREALLMRALLMADLAADASEQAGVSARPQAAFIAWRLAELNVDAAMRAEAIRLMEGIAAHDPHGLRTRLRLAEMYDAADRTSDAIAAYERTLAIDANFELDPLKQLSPDERDRIEQRLADLKQSNASPVAPDDPAARP